MSGRLQAGAGTVVALALIVAPIALGVHLQAQKRNFRVVREGVLYRSGQMTPAGLRRVLHDHGIRTVVSLRDGTTRADQATEEVCRGEEVYFVRIPITSPWGDLGEGVPAEKTVRRFREVMSEPRNYPVLVHCLGGIHRTGIFTAIYRMEFEHWSNTAAMQEMRACGYVELDEHLDVLGYLEGYRPTWKGPPPSLPDGPQGRSAPRTPVRHVVAKMRSTSQPPVAGGLRRKGRRKATPPRDGNSR
jgi:tyrosine-protein phosphatase SIW14